MPCFESNHLQPREWGLLSVCLRISRGGKNTLFFDGRKMAARFSGTSKTGIYRSAAKLVADGWLIPLNGTGRKRAQVNKRYEATEYRVLTHANWAAINGSERCAATCEKPFPSTGMDPGAIPKIHESHSQNPEIPFPPAGHSFVGTAFVESFVASSEKAISFVRAYPLTGQIDYSPDPTCGICDGSGLVLIPKHGTRRPSPCACRSASKSRKPAGDETSAHPQKQEQAHAAMGA